MVFMSMRQEHTAYLILVFDKIRHISNDQIDTVHFIVRKAETAVNDYYIVAVLENSKVFRNLAESSQRKHFQFFSF